MTGTLVHQRDEALLLFCSKTDILLSYRGRIRRLHSFKNVLSGSDGVPEGAVVNEF